MKHYTVFFIIVITVHVSGGFSAHHQELRNCTHSIWYVPSLLAATTSVVEFQLNHASGSSKQASLAHTRCCVCNSWAPDDGQKNHLKHVEH